MGYRIAIMHDGFIPVYRERFFELLNRHSAHEYVIIHGDPPTGAGHRNLDSLLAFPNLRVRNRNVCLGSRMVIFQPVVRLVLCGDFDAIVVGHGIRFVTATMLFLLFKLSRKPALLWGHGFHRPDASYVARYSSSGLARLADGYLAYTPGGGKRLRRAGVVDDRITVLRNTIDIGEQIKYYNQFTATEAAVIRAELGIRQNAHVLIYIGRLIARKRLDELVELVRRLNAENNIGMTDLLIVGDGPLGPMLKAQSADLPFVHFLGVRSDMEVARLLRISVAMVIPGFVGLAVTHSFAHGVPVITRSSAIHGPEIEYLADCANGLIVEGGFEAFVNAVASYLKDSAMQKRLSAGALAARANLSLDYNVRQFDLGVRRAIERRGRPCIATT